MKRFLSIVLIALASLETYAEECNHLNSKSAAYQICMLRKENTEREHREKAVAQLRMESEKKRIEDEADFIKFRDEGRNLLELARVMNNETQYLASIGVKDGGVDCTGVGTKYYAVTMLFCAPSVILVFATQNSSFGQLAVPLLALDDLKTIVMNGIDIQRDRAPVTMRTSKDGHMFTVNLSEEPAKYSQIKALATTKQDISLYMKYSKTDMRFLFNRYND